MGGSVSAKGRGLCGRKGWFLYWRWKRGGRGGGGHESGERGRWGDSMVDGRTQLGIEMLYVRGMIKEEGEGLCVRACGCAWCCKEEGQAQRWKG